MSANTYGRQVVLALTNKSGSGVIAGDVVIVDTTNNDAFTTNTAANFTGGVGIAQDTIANNAVGRVLVSGYAALVNVNASVTRGHFGATFTVAKQATDAGAARGAGSFCQFLTGGTTPDAMLWGSADLGGGSGMTNPMSAVGDIIQGTTAGAPAALAAPVAGKVLTGAGVTTPLVYAFPPGHEFDYVESTGSGTINATTEAAANTIITGSAVTYDGSTAVVIEAYLPAVYGANFANSDCYFDLFDGSSSIGWIGIMRSETTNRTQAPVTLSRRLTPSNAAHTYSIRAHIPDGHTGGWGFGAGGPGTMVPGYIRITKA